MLIRSIPYAVNKSALVERIAEVVIGRKLPPLRRRARRVHRRRADRAGAEAGRRREDGDGVPVQAHAAADQLQRQPDLPDPDRERRGRAARAPRPQVDPLALPPLPPRGRHPAASSTSWRRWPARIHLLEGFEKVFDALDEIIRIIRQVGRQAGRGRQDHEALRARRGADRRDPRAEDLPAGPARDPGHPGRAGGEADAASARWSACSAASAAAGRSCARRLEDVQRAHAGKHDARRTEIVASRRGGDYTADDFIVEEDNVVIVSQDGWVKRQKDVKDLATTRLREGDRVLACEAAATRATIAFFTNFGSAYTCRIVDVPASTGYGEPIQSLFKFRDGERVVAAMSLDPRAIGEITPPAEGAARAGARACRHQRRLQPAVQPRRLRRAEHAGRAPVRAAGRRRRGGRRGEGRRQRNAHRGHARGAGDAVPGGRGQLPCGPGQGRDPDQDRSRTKTACSGSSRRRETGTC